MRVCDELPCAVFITPCVCSCPYADTPQLCLAARAEFLLRAPPPLLQFCFVCGENLDTVGYGHFSNNVSALQVLKLMRIALCSLVAEVSHWHCCAFLLGQSVA
jgi:hypothetical protein